MPIYDFSRVPESDILCWEYTTDPDPSEDWEDVGGGMFARLSETAASFVRAAEGIGIPELNRMNVDEWMYRIVRHANLDRFYFFHDTPEGPVGRKPLVSELQSFLGFAASVPNVPTPIFEAACRAKHLEIITAYIEQNLEPG